MLQRTQLNNNTFLGSPCPRSLRVVPAAVQPQRAGVPGRLHAARHARDARVRRARRHQRLHHRARHGHEDTAH